MPLALELLSGTYSIGGLRPGMSLRDMEKVYGEVERLGYGPENFATVLGRGLQASIGADNEIRYIEAYGPGAVEFCGSNVMGMTISAVLTKFGKDGAVKTVGSDNISYMRTGLGFGFRNGRVSNVYCFKIGYFDGVGLEFEAV